MLSLVLAGTSFATIVGRSDAGPSLVLVDAGWRNDHTSPARYWLANENARRVGRTGLLAADYAFPPGSPLSPDGSRLLYVSGGALRVVQTRSGEDAAVIRLQDDRSLSSATWIGQTIYYTTDRRTNECPDVSPVELWRKRPEHLPERIKYESSYRRAAEIERPLYGAGIFAQIWLLGAAANGRWLLFGRQGLYRVAIDEETTHAAVSPLRLPSGFRLNGSQAALSPDGSRVAASLHSGANVSRLWLISAGGALPRPLTAEAFLNDALVGPIWSHDGDLIAAYREHSWATGVAARDVYLIAPDGSSRVRSVHTGRDNAVPVAFTNDGRLVMSVFRDSRSTVDVLDLRTNRSTRLLKGDVAVEASQG